jgi:hypothetical protein
MPVRSRAPGRSRCPAWCRGSVPAVPASCALPAGCHCTRRPLPRCRARAGLEHGHHRSNARQSAAVRALPRRLPPPERTRSTAGEAQRGDLAGAIRGSMRRAPTRCGPSPTWLDASALTSRPCAAGSRPGSSKPRASAPASAIALDARTTRSFYAGHPHRGDHRASPPGSSGDTRRLSRTGAARVDQISTSS